jgi:hypothetical protein
LAASLIEAARLINGPFDFGQWFHLDSTVSQRMRRGPADEHDLRNNPGFPRPTNACAARRANHARRWSSIGSENIPLLFSCKSVHPCTRPTRQEGRLAIVTNARWDAVDAEAMTDEAGMTRTAKSCGSDAAVLASSSREASFLGATVAKQPFTGESTK